MSSNQPAPDNKAPINLQDSNASPELPKIGRDLRVKQQIIEILSSSPEGKKLDEYFGISTGNPEQTLQEAQHAESLLGRLSVAQEGSGELGALFNDIADHANRSSVDPEALRALMRGSKKFKN